ncbi:MAG: hypothetical protein K9L86_07205 [Candidatus Omnitrophica bacterium]|nr:hypothetical protein [Candidatus Omnitrophota bacterium]
MKKIVVTGCLLSVITLLLSFSLAEAKSKGKFLPSSEEFLGPEGKFKESSKDLKLEKKEFLGSSSDIGFDSVEVKPSTKELMNYKYRAVVIDRKYYLFGKRRSVSSGKFALSESVSSSSFNSSSYDFLPSSSEFKVKKRKGKAGR